VSAQCKLLGTDVHAILAQIETGWPQSHWIVDRMGEGVYLQFAFDAKVVA
jgi:hypothetical protein